MANLRVSWLQKVHPQTNSLQGPVATLHQWVQEYVAAEDYPNITKKPSKCIILLYYITTMSS
jgi:hypothetical protein